VEKTYRLATIRAYFPDFAAFIALSNLNNQSTLPANSVITTDYSSYQEISGGASAVFSL
jgi:hypothetical protein